jgi:hypothetical protein
VTRRRWLYPLAVLIAAAAVWLSDRMFRPAAPEKKPLPPVRYSGPLEMRPGPATPPATKESGEPAKPAPR